MGKRNAQAAAFLAGRDLAVELVREGLELREDFGEDNQLIDAGWRRVLQNRWAQKYFQRLVDDPSLMDGFAAVLSDFLGAACPYNDAKHYAELALDEMIGPPGAALRAQEAKDARPTLRVVR